MTATKPANVSVMLARLVLPMLLACAATVAQGQTVPAQVPLLTKAGAAVAPNVMLTMDDSGSMGFRHMPEDVFAADTYAIANPVNSRTVVWDPSDNYMTGTNFIGTIPGISASTNYRLRGMRSPDTNTIFYNPSNLYLPWLTSDGVMRLPDSPPNGAYTNPLIRTGAAGTVVDLTAVKPHGSFTAGSFIVGATYTIVTKGTTDFRTIGSANNNPGNAFVATGVGSGDGKASAGSLAGWCYANAANGDCAAATSAFLHDPGAYFRLTKSGGVYNSVTVATNYTAYSINGAASFPKVAARTDCSGAVGPTGCSQANERQNFANWYTYYRSRNLLARGSLMEAFGVEPAPIVAGTFVIGSSYVIVSVGTTNFTTIGAASNAVDTVFIATAAGGGTGTARAISMRLGFGRINKGSATVDGAKTTVIESSNTYGGGGVRDFSFARKADLFKWLEDLPASGGTPLVSAMDAVGKYYSRTSSQSPWTNNPAVTTNVVADNKTCRRSYQIILTDGYWNGAVVAAGNQDNEDGNTITSVGGATYKYAPTFPYKDAWSDTLADVAMKYWKTDLQPATNNAVPAVAENTSFWQNMTNFTVGLGVRGTLNPAADLPALTAGTKVWPKAETNATAANVDDLWHAALNSRGQYFSAEDPQSLSLAIRTALAGATGGSGSTAGVATASSVLTGGNRKYVPSFISGSWEGDIVAFPLDASGQTTAAVWKAADKMPVWNSRNVVTFDKSAAVWKGISFDWASLSSSPTSQSALGTVAGTYTTQFIDYLKGDHSQEGAGKPFRSRINLKGEPFVLGDIVNANPVLIKGNFNGSYIDPAFGGTGAYQTFVTGKKARTAVLFAGSNDGMLHAFRDSVGVTPATDGEEIFAYVPRAVYGNLGKLADKNYGTTSTLTHQYFVDGPLHEADAYVNAPGATTPTWRNYLLGSLGSGGRAIFALDVTASTAMTASAVRWELSNEDDADLGYVLSPIKVGVLPNGRWVAIFGNGYGSTGSSSTTGNAVLFVVDIEDAASSNATTRAGAVKKLTLDNTGGNGLGGVTVVPNLATGRTQYIYVGDLKGKLWKLVYDSTAASGFSVQGGTALFTATDAVTSAPQPITATPAVFNHSSGGQLVIFGTGKLFATTDATDTSPQSIYSVWDKSPDTTTRPLTRAKLATRSLTSFAGTGGALGTTFYSSTGAAVDYNGTERGWVMDIASSITGGRVIYPSQVISYNTALISSVAPVQGTPLACESGTGTAVNIVTPVQSGTNGAGSTFDTNGDGLVNASDVGAIGYSTKADGVDAVVTSGSTASGGTESGSGGIGGGASENECTGAKCKKAQKCVYSSICGVGKCLVSIQNSATGVQACNDPGTDLRIWRRIINPPVR